MRETCWKLVTY